MRVAILNSNTVKIFRGTKKGTEFFDYNLIKNLSKIAKTKNLQITTFASGNSKLPTKLESVNYYSSSDDKHIQSNNHVFFELALISKAFSMHNKFDLFHVNLGGGEYMLPFAGFIKKPIVVTLHGPLNLPFQKKYYSFYKDLKNVFYVSISNSQRKPMPYLNYIKTIYHGIDVENEFPFDPIGGKEMFWCGRASPDKGLEHVLTVIKKVKKKAKLFPMMKEEYLLWLQNEIIKKRNLINEVIRITINFDVGKKELAANYQTSKLFLFPLQWEEPFGFTMIESMACGTPVIAYARGSVPEVLKDGETGFIVNASDTDIRGDWIVKKTGIDGLCEAVERIYSMPEEKYLAMRRSCRAHVEAKFTVERMVDEYVKVYEEILAKK